MQHPLPPCSLYEINKEKEWTQWYTQIYDGVRYQLKTCCRYGWAKGVWTDINAARKERLAGKNKKRKRSKKGGNISSFFTSGGSAPKIVPRKVSVAIGKSCTVSHPFTKAEHATFKEAENKTICRPDKGNTARKAAQKSEAAKTEDSQIRMPHQAGATNKGPDRRSIPAMSMGIGS